MRVSEQFALSVTVKSSFISVHLRSPLHVVCLCTYTSIVVCYKTRPGRGGGGRGMKENQLISSSTQSQYLKTTLNSDLVQNKLIPTSLGTDWIENERFELVFAKTIIFMPKTGSINSDTVNHC
jgi:hypothetical protein